MNYYDEIKNKLTQEEIYARVKDYSKERHKIETYYEVGKILSEAGKHYGEDILGQYAIRLQKDVGKKYSVTTLKRMRQFFEMYEKSAPSAHQLTWSHYIELLPLKDINAIKYYNDICVQNNLSRNQLRNKIKAKEYERLPKETKEKIIIKNNKQLITDYIKNPIIIKNNNYKNKISEKLLQCLILEDIPSFLKELGNGFTFIENEYKIKVGDTYNYIDLLLYNIKYKCYVVIELKVVPLKKEHIGQIELYMNYINRHLKTINENNTVGIIICLKNNKYVIEYCTNKNIISREYVLI